MNPMMRPLMVLVLGAVSGCSAVANDPPPTHYYLSTQTLKDGRVAFVFSVDDEDLRKELHDTALANTQKWSSKREDLALNLMERELAQQKLCPIDYSISAIQQQGAEVLISAECNNVLASNS